MIFDYCPLCSEKLHLRKCGDEGEVPFCNACNRPFFPFSYPCVICLCVSKETSEIALIKQSYVSPNYINVAGYIKRGETSETTAVREVQEEIDLEVTDLRYIRSYYHEKSDNLMLGFVCFVKRYDLVVSCEVDSACWFDLNKAVEMLRFDSIGRNLLEEFINSQI